MKAFLILPFILQGAAMTWDEFHFHARRGLGKWERIGHPLDTLAFLFCLALVGFGPMTPGRLSLYLGAALFSTLLITKDEWVHARECTPMEQWLHAILFAIHPVVLIEAAWLWQDLGPSGSRLARVAFSGYFVTVLLFFSYQTLYWNFLNANSRVHQQ